MGTPQNIGLLVLSFKFWILILSTSLKIDFYVLKYLASEYEINNICYHAHYQKLKI